MSQALPNPLQSPKWAILAAALLSLAVYWPSLGYEFVYDDGTIIGTDERLDDAAFGYQVWVAPWWPAGSVAPASRPLTSFTFWAQVQLHGRHEAAFHFVNVVLFAALSGAVAWLTWRWLGSLAAAWAVGILFAVHPIHVEVAANIVGRAEILSGLFMALAVGLYLKWRPPEGRGGTASGGEGRAAVGRGSSAGFTWRRALIIGLMILLAGLSKEHGYFVAPMLGLIELAHRRIERVPLLRAIPWKVIGAIAAVAIIAVMQRQTMIGTVHGPPRMVNELDNPLPHASMHERIVTPFKLVGKATVLLAAPIEQSPDYSPRMLMPTTHLSDPLVLLGIAVVIAWIAATALAWRNRHIALGPLLMLPVAWFIPSNTLLLIGTIFGERLLTTLSIFLPIALAAIVMNINVPRRAGMMVLLVVVALGAAYIGNVFGSFMPYAEAGMLAPAWQVAVVGVVIAAAVAAFIMHRRLRVPPWGAGVIFILISACGMANVLYSGLWKDVITLTQSTVLRHPTTGRFQGFMAEKLLGRGITYPEVRDEFYAQAEVTAKKALELWPRQVRPYVVLAVIAQHRGEEQKAQQYIDYVQRAIGDDVYANALFEHMGLKTAEDLREELKTLNAQLEQNPGDREIKARVAKLEVKLGDVDRGLKLYQELDTPPSTDPAFLEEYAYALLGAGNLPGALDVYRRWIALAPGNHVALTDGAFVAVALGDPGSEAVAWIQRAMQISPGASEPWAALGEWHRNRGDIEQAMSAYHEAIRRTTPDDPKRVQYQLMIDKLRMR